MNIDRREFLTVSLATAATLASAKISTAADPAPASQPTTAPNAKPNILLILGDDHAYTDSGAYGNKEVQTPNIDRLAKQSLLFNNAHTAGPMCVPSRAMLYTGQYPVKNGAYPNHSISKPGTLSVAQYLKKLGYRVGLAGKIHVEPKEVFDFDYMPSKEEPVEKFIAAPGPFCLIYASHHPHAPWGRGTYDPAKLTLPIHFVDTPEARQALADYYYEVTELDKEIGMCLDLLDKHKLTDNTLTIYTSEQGAPFPHGKWTCYDLAIKTEFIARWPGHITPNTTSNTLISYADFVPTCIEMAGGEQPKNLDGKSLLPLFAGKDVVLHNAVFGIQTTRGIIRGSESYPIRSIRTLQYKYIWNLNPTATFQNVITNPRPTDNKAYWNSWLEKAKTDPAAQKLVHDYQHRPEEELYDITADPDELKNLADDPKLAAVKADLKKRLQAWMTEQGDKGLETEMDAKNHQTPGPDRE